MCILPHTKMNLRKMIKSEGHREAEQVVGMETWAEGSFRGIS